MAALVPRPRLHLIRFHGVLAPNARLRKAVVPVPPQTVITPAYAGDCAHTPTRTIYGQARKLIAAIEAPAVIQRILTHLGLAARPPPRAPARRVDLLQAG